MPFDANGVFSLTPGYQAVAGQVIQPSQHNPVLEDISISGLSNVLVRDGRAPMTGNLNMNTAFKVTNLLAGSSPLDAVNKTQLDAVNTRSAASEPGYINGLTLTNNVSDAANDIDIAAGAAASDGATVAVMTLASALTKRLDASWAVGSGNGGLDTGAVGNNVYYVWLIQRSDTGVVDALFSLSSTSPTMPANYDRKRLIGSFARVAASNCAARYYSTDITNWVVYVPTFTGVGTATGVKAKSRRIGSNLEVIATFTTGVTTAVPFSMTLGVGGISGNVISDTYYAGVRLPLGSASFSLQSASYVSPHVLGGSQGVNIGIGGAGRNATDPVDGVVLGNSTVVNISISVPIEGWN